MRKRKPLAVLAAALAEMAQTESTIESRADAVLTIVKSEGIRTLKAFNAAVREAYRANGWHAARGRPTGGIQRPFVPQTVKQYVSIVRASFRLGIHVGQFKSFYALRQTLKQARLERKPKAVRRDPRMIGLTLVQHDTLTGAPFHDLAVLYEKANRQVRSKLVTKVQGILREFRPAIAPVLELRRAA